MAKGDKKIRFSEWTNVHDVWDPKAKKMVSSYSVREVIVPAGSRKAKVLKLTARLKELSDSLEIPGHFAAEMARIVHNWKKPQNRVCRKPKMYFPILENELKFKPTFKTATKQLRVMIALFKDADDIGIDADGKTELKRVFHESYYSLPDRYPKEFPKLHAEMKCVIKMAPGILRSWYARYHGEPEFTFDGVPDEEIKSFFEAKCAETKEG